MIRSIGHTRAVHGVVCSLLLCAPGTATLSAEATAISRGATSYQKWCLPCHGAKPGENGRLLPGTAALQIKYRGSVPAVIEQRRDLAAPVLRTYLRRGSWSMPPFRKSELSDAAIDDIAAYIAAAAGRP